MNLHARTGCISLVAVLFLSAMVTGDDHFMVIGGGPTPHSNQISLEKNVLFCDRVIESIREDQPKRYVYFADGKIDKPDLQYEDPNLEISEATLWMSRLFGDEHAVRHSYRDHEVGNVAGPTRKSHIKQQLYELAEQLESGDRLILYVTAHGGAGQSDDYYGNPYDESSYYDTPYGGETNEYDTTILLWNNESMSVSELDGWLNKFSKDVRIVLIMAQCHSGGFAHSIFHHADRKQGINPQVRVGFFSQQHDRAAAGCTPEIDEKNYREYSTYFWEAIGGESRSGDPVESADFDKDGAVSLAEAHSHAIISSDNLDIPVTSTEAFLRRFSRVAPPREESADEESPGFFGSLFGAGGKAAESDEEANMAQPLGREQTIEQLRQLARPEQQAVIDVLKDALKIKPNSTVTQVRRRASKLGKEVESASQLWGAASMLVTNERDLLSGSLVLQYPAMGNESFSPQMLRFLTDDADKFLKFIEEQPQSDAYLKAVEQAKQKETKMDRVVNREAQARRLLRMLDMILLESNLEYHATEDQIKHFQRMIEEEQKPLTATATDTSETE